MFEIGQVFEGVYPPEAAVWCNSHGAHIEPRAEGGYVIALNPPAPEPSAQERVAALEAQTGLIRAMREMVLAENSGVSDYVKAKAREIETLAAPLRGAAV